MTSTTTPIQSSLISASTAVAQKAQHLTSTPSSKIGLPASHNATPSPGSFRHPRTSEIISRQSATILTDTRRNKASINLAALLLTFVAGSYWRGGDALFLPSTTIWWILWILRSVLVTQIIRTLRPALPYISKQDQITDIPLTPSQRMLLGLDPSVQSTPTSAASGLSYITPPKYRRLSGSTNGSPNLSTDRRSISANYSASPLSTSRYTVGFSPTPSHSVRRASGSPFSPSPSASPLFHKALNQTSSFPEPDFSASTRSLGMSSGLGRSQSLRERSRRESLEPSSPTPVTRSPQLVAGVNYKWLYDKGRKLPKNDSYKSFF